LVEPRVIRGERELPEKAVNQVAVIGAGSMGHAIAQIMAMAGFGVSMTDVNREFMQKGYDRIKWSLEKFVEKRTIRQEEMDGALARIKLVDGYANTVSNADFVVEAAPEDLELKKKIFSEVDAYAPAHAIIASNTSTLSITAMGSATKRPEMVVGMHFFNPPQLMPLVEVVKGAGTSDETAQTTIELAKKLGKTPVLVRKDVRGFIVNSVLGCVFNEAFWALYRTEATRDQIDSAVKYKAGFPMGIFELADFVGLDIIDSASKQMAAEYQDRVKIPPVAEPMAKAGKLGQKSGEGFYNWKAGRPRIPFELADDFDVDRIYAVAVNGAAWLVHQGVAVPGDIDTGMKFGAGWPSGPCELGDKLGLYTVTTKLQELNTRFNDPSYKACPLLEDYVSKGWLGRKSKRGFYTYEG
jgi:enoyl-CoA hydratase/3-hydroxyacyl-CoA dehydrogenase